MEVRTRRTRTRKKRDEYCRTLSLRRPAAAYLISESSDQNWGTHRDRNKEDASRPKITNIFLQQNHSRVTVPSYMYVLYCRIV